MFRLAVLVSFSVLFACGQRRVGELSARDHAFAGRPREALSTLTRDRTSAQNALLNQAALLHASGKHSQSDEAFSKVDTAGLHELELTAIERLRAVDAAVLQQDVALLQPILAETKTTLAVIDSAQSSILILLERGWAPELSTAPDSSAPDGPPVASADLKPIPRALLRLDEGEPFEPTQLVDDGQQWAAKSLERYNAKQQALASPLAVFDISKRMQAIRESMEVWWTAPTQFAVVEVVTTPGPHVVMLPAGGGQLRERRVDLAPGQRLLMVTRL